MRDSMRDIINPCNYDGWLSLAGFLLACFKARDSLIVKGFKFPSLISDEVFIFRHDVWPTPLWDFGYVWIEDVVQGETLSC